MSFDQFSDTIRSIFYFSTPIALIAGGAIVFLEMLIAVLVLWKKSISYAAMATILLCFSFIGIHIMKMVYHISVPCSCFGALYKMHPLFSILVNLMCIASSVYLLPKGTK